MTNFKKITLLGISIGIIFSTGFLLGGRTKIQANFLYPKITNVPYDDINLDPIWKAWMLLDEKFAHATTTKQTTNQAHVWGMIEGLAESYNDPYTVFFPPQQSKSFEEDVRGTFGGIGTELSIKDKVLTVMAPLEGTPAKNAGVLAGDLIIKVDGESTRNMSIDDAVEAIRGEIDTEVTLTIARKGEHEFLDISIVRGKIEIPTLDSELRDDGVYVLSLYNFGGTATREVRQALREFIETDSKKLLIDLRGNPGGYLDAAVDISSWFLPVGKVVAIEDFGDTKDKYIHRSKGYNISKKDWRIAILVDGGSASASEIMAGALHEHEKAVLIGKQTFGKGSVQELVDVTNDTSMKITVARWLTPHGVSISNAGLTPDLEVDYTFEDMQAEIDYQFDAAVNYLNTGELNLPDGATNSETKSEEESSKEVDELEEIE